MDFVVTTQAGHLIACELRLHHVVWWFFLERPGVGVAVQTLPVFVRLIERELWAHLFEVVDVEVFQATNFRVYVAEHGVVGMAGKTRAISRYPIILKMARWNISGFIYV